MPSLKPVQGLQVYIPEILWLQEPVHILVLGPSGTLLAGTSLPLSWLFSALSLGQDSCTCHVAMALLRMGISKPP